MKNDTLKIILINKLKDRGMFVCMGGSVIIPPSKMYNTTEEEILWILKESDANLSVEDIAKYLMQDHESVRNILNTFTSTSKSFVKRRNGYYTANINYNMDVPSAYKLLQQIIKSNTKTLTKGMGMSEFTITSMNRCLNAIGLEFKPARVNGVLPIKKIENRTVVAAIHPITKRFWIKNPSNNGVNGNYETLTAQIASINELKLSSQHALALNS